MQRQNTIRIFISSTFADFIEERDYLQNHVFPKLRTLCNQFGARLQVIDLRWGVSEEAGLDQKTIRICLDEIARCQRISPRPNFVALLGDRYGWQPIPDQIFADEFCEIVKIIDQKNPNVSQLFNQWYAYDANAVPPVYYLKSRKGKYRDYQKWTEIESLLLRYMRDAVKSIILHKDNEQKYFLSATGQEILHGALSPPDHIPPPTEHVFCFNRSIQNIPAAGNYLIAKVFFDINIEGGFDIEAKSLLDDLKKRLWMIIPDNVYNYISELTGQTVTTDHITQLGLDVEKRLSAIIEKQLSSLVKKTDLENEIELHNAFLEERTSCFYGQDNIINKVLKYFSNNDKTNNSTLCIYGPGGSGKSSLIAAICKRLLAEAPDAFVAFRFIGFSPQSSNGKNLLESLCEQIALHYGWHEYKRASSFFEQTELFKKALTFANLKQPIYIILDALDQLIDTDNVKKLEWLPITLPANVKLLVSTLPNESLDILSNFLPTKALIKIDKLSAHFGKKIIESWLSNVGRTLQEEQIQQVLSNFNKQGRPLYLKLAFEEVRHWRWNDESKIVPGINAMIRKLFNRLTRESNHGFLIVSRSLGYLASAKNGLAEDELLDLLSIDKDVLREFKRRSPKSPDIERLPVVVWSRLYFDLEPFLIERNIDGASLFDFFHRQFRHVTGKVFLKEPVKLKLHETMAWYYWEQNCFMNPAEQTIPNLRKLSELAFHLTNAKMFEKLKVLLCDPLYFKAKLHADRVLELFDELCLVYKYHKEREKEAKKNQGSSDITIALFRFFVSLGSIYNELLSLEDIHASLVYRADVIKNGLYKDFLKLGINELTREKYCHGDNKLAMDVEITFSLRLANMQRRAGELASAQKKYQSILPLLKNKTHLKHELSKVYYDMGYIKYLSGDFDGAVKQILQSAEMSSGENDEIGYWISQVVGGYIKSLSYFGKAEFDNQLRLFMQTCDLAYSVFLRHQSTNTTAERFVMNCNAHRLVASFHLNDYKACNRYFQAIKNDSWLARQRNIDKHLVPLARLAILRGKGALAARYLKEYLEPFEKEGNNVFTREAFVQIYYLAGLAYFIEGESDAAKQAWNKGFVFPDKPGNHIWKKAIRDKIVTVDRL